MNGQVLEGGRNGKSAIIHERTVTYGRGNLHLALIMMLMLLM